MKRDGLWNDRILNGFRCSCRKCVESDLICVFAAEIIGILECFQMSNEGSEFLFLPCLDKDNVYRFGVDSSERERPERT